MMIGTAGASLIMGGIFLFIGAILHKLMSPPGNEPGTDPLVVRACLTAMTICWSLFGIIVLCGAARASWYFVKVAMGKERL